MTLRFTWVPAKAESNRRKHHVTFETAARVFADPFALTEQDRVEGGEYRWQTIGSIEGLVVLLVAHTLIDQKDGVDIVQIISARRATRAERLRYEQKRFGQLHA